MKVVGFSVFSFLRACAFLLLFCPGALTAPAEQPPPSEYQVKAAFLFNFAKFVEWPPQAFPEPASPFTIGVIGDNPFGDDLERTLKDKAVNGRPFVSKQVKGLAELKTCHILF